MIIDTGKVKKIIDSNISADQISSETGITKRSLYKYRNGDADIKNMRIDSAIKLQNLYDKLEDKKMTNIKIKGVKKAVGEYNGWQGAARIYLDKENLSVETYVYADGNSWEEFNGQSVVEVANKVTISERDNKITMRQLQEWCEERLQDD